MRILFFQNISPLEYEEKRPANWEAGSPDKNYRFSSDDAEAHSGGWSMRIKSPTTASSTNYGWAAQCIAASSKKGKAVTLSGFLTTKEVSDGYAGLWVRGDDAKGQVLNMDNMQGRGLSGTNDWTKATVTLNLTKEVTQICAGALLTGRGLVWIDDLVITE